jgi:hypothetical protein
MTDEKYIVTKIEKVSNTRDNFYIQPIDSHLTNTKDGHIFNSFEAPHGSFELGDSVQPIYSYNRIIGARKLTYEGRIHARIIDATGTMSAFCEEYGDITIQLTKVSVPVPARGDEVIIRKLDDNTGYEILENITLLKLRRDFLYEKAGLNELYPGFKKRNGR